MNPNTTADTTWVPLLNTPPYPSHSSNMTCVGVSSAQALARAFGLDDVSFSVTWVGTGTNPNVTRQYTSFSESSEPEEVMRVLNEYHGALGDLVFRFGGTLERFTGDGLIVIFNDPMPCPDANLVSGGATPCRDGR